MDIYTAAVQRMKPNHISHHNSHLYLLMTRESMPIVREYRRCGGAVEEIFEEKTDLYWYYLPFAYTPYWHKRFRAAVEGYAWEFIRRNEPTGTTHDWSDENIRRTFGHLRVPPHENFYNPIRLALHSILINYSAPADIPKELPVRTVKTVH